MGDNIKQLWDPPDKATEIHYTTPQMLLIPSNLIEFLTTIPRTPWELYSHIAGLVAADGSQWTDDDWKFMVEWCIMATQVDPNHGSSWLAFEFDGGSIGGPSVPAMVFGPIVLNVTGEQEPERFVPIACGPTAKPTNRHVSNGPRHVHGYGTSCGSGNGCDTAGCTHTQPHTF